MGAGGVVPVDPVAIGVSIIPIGGVSIDCADLGCCIRHKGRGVHIWHKGTGSCLKGAASCGWLGRRVQGGAGASKQRVGVVCLVR